MLFADLRTPDARSARSTTAMTTPLLFLGEWVEFEDLQLKNLRQFEGWYLTHEHPAGRAAGRQSASAGLPQLRRSGDAAASATRSPSCARNASACSMPPRRSSRFCRRSRRPEPAHAHDSAGHARNTSQARPVGNDRVSDAQRDEDGETFEWDEYLLFNPYKGFRYLTEYDGHWNFVTPLEAMPQSSARCQPLPVFYEGTYTSISPVGRRPPLSCSANFPGASKWATVVARTTTSIRPTCCLRKRPATK